MDGRNREIILPRYNEIPNVGLYLKQVVKLINDVIEPFMEADVTEAMLSNYVKKHIISSPVKKQYDREQTAKLIFIVFAKNAASLDNIALLLKRQEQAYSAQEAYDFFAESMENALKAAYSGETEAAPASEGEKTELTILRTIIHTVASKCFLESCFAALRESESGGDGECSR